MWSEQKSCKFASFSKGCANLKSNYYEFQMFADSVAEQAQTERDKAEIGETVGQFQLLNFRNFFE